MISPKKLVENVMIKSAVTLYPSVNFEVEGRECESWAEKGWSALAHLLFGSVDFRHLN